MATHAPTSELVLPVQALPSAHQTAKFQHETARLHLKNLLPQFFATLAISTVFTHLSAAQVTFRAVLAPSSCSRNQMLTTSCTWCSCAAEHMGSNPCSPRDSASSQSSVCWSWQEQAISAGGGGRNVTLSAVCCHLKSWVGATTIRQNVQGHGTETKHFLCISENRKTVSWRLFQRLKEGREKALNGVIK